MSDDPDAVEIEAYIDGQLDPARRFVVEHYLSRQPARAAQVMRDLSTRSGLQILLHGEPGGQASAPSLQARPWSVRRALPFAASLAGVIAVGASLTLTREGPPGYVDYAVSSHRVAMLRADMASQIEAPRYDMREIARSTSIALPHLPTDWRVTDVQLFPTNKGPALLVAIRTQGDRKLSIFAVRERTDAPEQPDAIREGAQSVAYWRQGDMSYALTGDAEPGAIDATAEELARSWS